MSTHLTVDCPITSTEDPFGEYANAFRVLNDGGDLLLDFCLYSAQANTAKLISRIRVKPQFLHAIHERLESSLEKVPETATIYVMPEVGGSQ